MPLMFQRLARNFAKNGYFPTDEETTLRTLQALEPGAGAMKILDPCCGEGVALAECKSALGASAAQAFGVEYDAERAWHAKGLLDRCIHGDLQQCIVGRRQFGLLWLNPPYGDLVSEKSGVAQESAGRKRLEKLFYQLSYPTLAYGGIMVLIVPHYVLDREFIGWIVQHFHRVRVFRAAEQRFKQVVVFGVRRRSHDAGDGHAARAALETARAGDLIEELPKAWPHELYRVPSATTAEPVKFVMSTLEPRQLQEDIKRLPTLWPQFQIRFSHAVQPHRRPLRPLSRWHLALALAAGQVSGLVTSSDGRRFLVKGATHKEKSVHVDIEHDDKGNEREVRILTDRFVPTIRAIDFTPGPGFGEVVEIR